MRFGRYAVARHLGMGVVSDTYLCRQSGVGGFEKLVVVKRLRPDHIGDPVLRATFLDEARVAAHLSHSNLAHVFEVDVVGGVPQIVLEYVPGPTLSALIRRARQESRLDVAHAAKIMSGVCAGLHHAHAARDAQGAPLGVVHVDLRPKSIIVSTEGVPKLLDFGAARHRGPGAQLPDSQLRFLAPELLDGQPADARADVFAAGACLYEAATGRRLRGALTRDDLIRLVRDGDYLLPSELDPEFPPELERIITWALNPDPGLRCPSARDLHDALDAFTHTGLFASTTRAVGEYVGSLFPQGPPYGVARGDDLTGRTHGFDKATTRVPLLDPEDEGDGEVEPPTRQMALPAVPALAFPPRPTPARGAEKDRHVMTIEAEEPDLSSSRAAGAPLPRAASEDLDSVPTVTHDDATKRYAPVELTGEHELPGARGSVAGAAPAPATRPRARGRKRSRRVTLARVALVLALGGAAYFLVTNTGGGCSSAWFSR
jgi:serine/threonine-protein kinase